MQVIIMDITVLTNTTLQTSAENNGKEEYGLQHQNKQTSQE